MNTGKILVIDDDVRETMKLHLEVIKTKCMQEKRSIFILICCVFFLFFWISNSAAQTKFFKSNPRSTIKVVPSRPSIPRPTVFKMSTRPEILVCK